MEIRECKRDNLCQDCNEIECTHCGHGYADCVFYQCMFDDEYYEQCDQCLFNPRYYPSLM